MASRSDAPEVVYWEMTRACDLACAHCRDEAEPYTDPDELSTLEAMRVINDIRRFGRRTLVLTGGDPMKRWDLVELVRHGSRVGLDVHVWPAATPLVTRRRLEALREAGMSRVAVGIDGATAGVHEEIRGAPGSFQQAVEIARCAGDAGIPLEVNTAVGRGNLDSFHEAAGLIAELGARRWRVFVLVPTGPVRSEDLPAPGEVEAALERLAGIARAASFDVESATAPHYRRVVECRRSAAPSPAPGSGGAGSAGIDDAGQPSSGGADGRRPPGDGDGILYVSSTGEIHPSGFLRVRVGSVREDDIVEVYRTSPVLRRLRDPDRLRGKCGVCDFREVCGGARCRAYGLLGDWLASDPACAYVPEGAMEPVDVGAVR